MTDADALTLYANHRDPEAFAHLVQTYQGLVYGTCLRRLKDVADAEDATQETFLKLARRAGDIHTSLAAWLHAAALSSAADLARKAGRRRAREEAVARPATVPDAPDWPAIREALDAAMAELDDAQRGLIAERYFAGRTQADMAAEHGVSQPMMSRKLKDAIGSLRSKLEGKGFGIAGGALTAGLSAEAVAAPAMLTAQLTGIGVAGVGGAKTAGLAVSSKLAIGTAGFGAIAVLMIVPIVLVAALFIMASDPPVPSPPAPVVQSSIPTPSAMRGTWRGVVRLGERTVPITMRVDDQQVVMAQADTPDQTTTLQPVRLDTSEAIDRIDLRAVSGNISPIGSVAHAIFNVEADVLRLAFYDRGDAYPESFADRQAEVYELQRVDDDALTVSDGSTSEDAAIVATGRQFLSAIADGQIELAMSLSVEGQFERAGLERLHEAVDLSDVQIVRAFRGDTRSVLVTAVVGSRGAASGASAQLGLTLTKLDGQWLMHDGDFLPTADAVARWLADYKGVEPGASELGVAN